jgi:hypothetical protein
MNRQLFALSVGLFALGAIAQPLNAQSLPSRTAIELRVEALSQQPS